MMCFVRGIHTGVVRTWVAHVIVNMTLVRRNEAKHWGVVCSGVSTT